MLKIHYARGTPCPVMRTYAYRASENKQKVTCKRCRKLFDRTAPTQPNRFTDWTAKTFKIQQGGSHD